ncbi:MAG: endonuclease/exonuclease/phosphatase family protein [Rheinheimera sp.]|nr:endonuclease/exonuclease/phosphatase family protein [Rheinheimera sp.]
MKIFNLLLLFFCTSGGSTLQANELTIATFNVSMESENYVPAGTKLGPHVLADLLAKGKHPQIKNIAAIIQQVQPDILLLNEFDYIDDPKQGIELFIENYLSVSQNGGKPINYPYYFYQTVNTGEPSGFDLDRDGKTNSGGEDAWGFGNYPGQYGMMVLSKYPLDTAKHSDFSAF